MRDQTSDINEKFAELSKILKAQSEETTDFKISGFRLINKSTTTNGTNQYHIRANKPPSMARTWPFTKLPPGDTKKSTTGAISSGSAHRPVGTLFCR